jgi:hypothetical protein
VLDAAAGQRMVARLVGGAVRSSALAGRLLARLVPHEDGSTSPLPLARGERIESDATVEVETGTPPVPVAVAAPISIEPAARTVGLTGASAGEVGADPSSGPGEHLARLPLAPAVNDSRTTLASAARVPGTVHSAVVDRGIGQLSALLGSGTPLVARARSATLGGHGAAVGAMAPAASGSPAPASSASLAPTELASPATAAPLALLISETPRLSDSRPALARSSALTTPPTHAWQLPARGSAPAIAAREPPDPSYPAVARALDLPILHRRFEPLPPANSSPAPGQPTLSFASLPIVPAHATAAPTAGETLVYRTAAAVPVVAQQRPGTTPTVLARSPAESAPPTAAATGAPPPSSERSLDLNRLAVRVSQILVRQLEVERERRGTGRW